MTLGNLREAQEGLAGVAVRTRLIEVALPAGGTAWLKCELEQPVGAFVDVLSPWDAAALQPIIEEAGGAFTDWSGLRTAFGGSAIATNRALGDTVRGVLASASDSSSTQR